NLVGFGATLADAEDIDGGTVVHRASVFAGATTDAKGRVKIGLFDFARIAVAIDDLCGPHVDGFGGGGAPLFADDAIGGHGPGQTAPTIIESRTNSDGFGVAIDAHDPTLGRRSNLPNGARRADLRTQHATRLAIADTRDDNGSPQAFEAGDGERWLQGVVGTNLHAFAAADASRQEVRFFQCARGT